MYQRSSQSSSAEALAKLVMTKRDYVSFCLGSLALCILLGAGQARSNPDTYSPISAGMICSEYSSGFSVKIILLPMP